jgi:hypothetical protein
MANLKTIMKVLAIFAISGALLLSLTHSAFSAAPPQRGDEATLNSSLLRAYPTTWYNYTWLWGLIQGEYPSTSKLYSQWPSDGIAHLRCEDGTSDDGYWFASNIDQTNWREGMTSVDFATTQSMWLEASMTSITGAQCPWDPGTWTGGKFDIIAVEKGTNPRTIMMEMYIWRTGVNTVWGSELARQTYPLSSTWNYLVALDHMRSDYGNGYEIEWDSNGLKYFEVNVLALLERGIFEINNIQLVGGLPVNGYPPNPPFDINNLRLARVDFALEAAWIRAGLPSLGPPWVEATLNSLRLRYNTYDCDGNAKVDMRDIGFVVSKCYSQFGDAGFDFRADINTDYVVNMRDVALLTANFGKKY